MFLNPDNLNTTSIELYDVVKCKAKEIISHIDNVLDADLLPVEEILTYGKSSFVNHKGPLA
jgi:hypothetical protein